MENRLGRLSRHYDSALKSMRLRRPDEHKALELLRKAVRASDPRAEYALGTWYLFGKGGLEKDPRQAAQLLKNAARAGLPDALFDLAVCYERGVGLTRNTTKAARLYLDAAIRGDHQAIFEIGRCFYAGIGVRKDRGIADVWFRRAEQLGVYEARAQRPSLNGAERLMKKRS